MYSLIDLGQIDLNITDLCNKTCSFCPRSDALIYPNNNQNMPLEMIELIVKQAVDHRFKGTILFAGRGESSCHPQYVEAFNLLHHRMRQYKTQVTTNGYKIDKYWDMYYKHLDKLILNTYGTKEEYDRRVKMYPKLKNVNVEHHFKPEGLSIEEINNLPPHRDNNNGKAYRYAFNHRCGLMGEAPSNNLPCMHPLNGIFINFNGEMQMCCNDWDPQVQYANVRTSKNIFHEYLTNAKLKKINWYLINGRRDMIVSCAKCNVDTDNQKRIDKIRSDSRLMNSLAKYVTSDDEQIS